MTINAENMVLHKCIVQNDCFKYCWEFCLNPKSKST